MNALDRAALRRAHRLAGHGSSPQASFTGAMHNRLNADWVLASIQSADQEVRQNLRTLKARSRELARNNSHAIRYLDLKADNVVGDEGIVLQSEVRTPQGAFWKEVNDRIEAAWQEWSGVGVCTACGRHSWVDVQRLTVVEEARDGDGFIRLLPAWRGNDFGFALQLLDPDQIDVDYNEPPGRDAKGRARNEIRMGVEIDEWGRSVAYHVWTGHPAEPEGRARERVRVPAEQMNHWCRPYRVGQTRGVPDFTPVLQTVKMLAGYEEAELVASRIAAAKGGFFERTDAAVQLMNFNGKEDEQLTMEVEPGLFDSLPPGWKFSAWDPTHPTSAFPQFHKAMLRTIAAGLGVSYHVLAQDLEGVSFSSIRTGMLAERDTYRAVQGSLWRHVHSQVYREWVKWALTTGVLELPRSAPMDPRAYYRVKWQPRGWDWVDPLKDAQASAMEIRLGTNSRTRIAAAKGRNFEDILEEIRHEEDLARAAEITLSTDLSRGGGSTTDESAEEGASESDTIAPFFQLARSGSSARTGRLHSLLNGHGGPNGTHKS
jgi:lambda family phage portal protein